LSGLAPPVCRRNNLRRNLPELRTPCCSFYVIMQRENLYLMTGGLY
jgi:hypothetical protein